MDTNWLKGLSASDIRSLYISKQVSPVDVIKGYLERIELYDPYLHSYISVFKNDALRDAEKAERNFLNGIDEGALQGIPIAVKDQFDMEGKITTHGSSIYSQHCAQHTSTVIERIKQAGGILLGKLNMTEFASGAGDPYKYGDPPRNPWNLELDPGSSSTGSGIAIAASLCMNAIGEDTGGSIRGPASANGIVGLRPTWGLVSRFGVGTLSWSMDAPGPMTRTVEDAARLLQVVSGYDQLDPNTSKRKVPNYMLLLKGDLKNIRIGVINEFVEPGHTDLETIEAVNAAISKFRELGAQVSEVSLPLLAEVGSIRSAISGSDAAFVHRHLLRTRSDEYGRGLRSRLLSASLIPGTVYQKAIRIRAVVRQEWLKLFNEVDVLISPTSLRPAGKIQYDEPVLTKADAELKFGGNRGTTAPASFAGTPAMSVPCGFYSNQSPIGLQIMANSFREDLVFKVGHAYQGMTDWHLKHPVLW